MTPEQKRIIELSHKNALLRAQNLETVELLRKQRGLLSEYRSFVADLVIEVRNGQVQITHEGGQI